MGGLATLLIVLGILTELLFVACSGLWPLPVEGLPGQLGSPLAAAAGGAAFLVGALLAGRARPDGAYALREVLLVLSGAASVALAVALLLGVARDWPAAALVGLVGAGSLEAIVSVGLGLRLATLAERRASLFVPGACLALLGAGFHVVVLALSV